MLLKWVDHEDFHKYERLIAIIQECGMVSLRQLAIITGWSVYTVKNAIHHIRQYQSASSGTEPSQWIQIYRLRRGNQDGSAYRLGVKAVEAYFQMTGMDGRAKEATQFQAMHYLGTNEILIRILETGIPKERITWHNTYEATEVLVRFHEKLGIPMDRRDYIRPDAFLTIDGAGYWLEYDNDTEGTRKIERKLHSYVKTLIPKPEVEPYPVIWVAPSGRRRDYLQTIWEGMKKMYYKDVPVPPMHFFVAGEETDPLLFKQLI